MSIQATYRLAWVIESPRNSTRRAVTGNSSFGWARTGREASPPGPSPTSKRTQTTNIHRRGKFPGEQTRCVIEAFLVVKRAGKRTCPRPEKPEQAKQPNAAENGNRLGSC